MEETKGLAADLHDRPIPDPPRPAVWIHRVERPALVLGSTQREQDLVEVAGWDAHGDGEAAPEICRRRSGGGLVTLLPGNDLWIDVVLPATSRLWVDDVGEAALWLGDVWAATLGTILPDARIVVDRGAADATIGQSALPVRVHRGPLRARDAGRLVCFAGLGPGEVTVAGRKVVGLSQRRTRSSARFQTVMTWSWPGRWIAPQLSHESLLAAGLDRPAVIDLAAGLPRSALGPTRRPAEGSVVAAFLQHLPRP